MRRYLVSAAAIVSLLVWWSSGVVAQEAPPDPPASGLKEKVDLLLSGYLIGVFPQNKDLSVGGSQISNTDVRGTIGAGVKFDVYPWFTNKMLGLEIEMFGLGASVKAPRTTSGSGTTQAQGNLIAVSTMYNVMLRYPGVIIQPYIGVGAGSSTGILYGVNIQSGNTALTGSSGDWAFAYQFLGGLRAFVTKKLFLFGEYKYFVSKYSWDSGGGGNQQVKLDFQTQLVSGGIGWSF